MPDDLLLNPTSCQFMVLVVVVVVLYMLYKRRVAVYLLDFSCYKPPNSNRLPISMFLENLYLDNQFDPESIAFQTKILEKSGFGSQTCLHHSFHLVPRRKKLSFTMEEATSIIFPIIKDLLDKTNISPRAIDILICNNSLFCPTPSLTAMVVNRFRMRSNIKSFNLSGMGCSAGIISVGLVKDLLRTRPNSLALIVSTEMLTLHWYAGKNPSMLLGNCLFRMGGAAILMSSRNRDKSKAKYELQHLVRINKAQDNCSYRSVYQDLDTESKPGVTMSKDILHVAAGALKLNIATLGPLVLPISEQLKYIAYTIYRKMGISRKTRHYVPNFKKPFQHFCIHAGGKAVIKAIEQNLALGKMDAEPSKMTLHRFGNTSSSSIWYELSYIEAKGRMKRGDRVWQIAFGSGFKCNTAVWKCICKGQTDGTTPWRDEIHIYPIEVPETIKIN
ncbi:hypothetical protein Tsubulata_016283 [Turnera subulata]|uniref:3-ketoacyl-CoA synthase n=1 Tax=Turnera subulata TaxID=218843 RepID=A0A9Q0FM66_9ROSI|nr:hypothetical protein Tsubulata_016283 [Turnera subulata]